MTTTTTQTLSELVCQAADSETMLDLKTACLEAELDEIRQKHQAAIEAAKKDAAAARSALESHCWTHRNEVMGSKQSVKVAGHTISFKLTPPKVETAEGVTEQDAICRIESMPASLNGEQFLSREVKLNKHALLRWWDTCTDALKRCGLVRTQKEQFGFKRAKAETTTPDGGAAV